MLAYKKAPTRKDVAELAGVSETVVSYVINNNRYVAQEKRERVLKAVEELNYRPSSIARALKGKRTNTILFICDNISSEYFGRIVDEMDRLAYDRDYLISLLRERNDDQFVTHILSRSFDGIVISATSFDEKYVLRLIDSGIPVVLLMNKNYHRVGNRAAKIYTGLYEGMKQAVNLLVGQGRRKIVYVDRVSPYHNFSTIEDWRYSGFITQMQECGLHVSSDNVLVGYESEDQLAEGLKQRIRDGLEVDAIIGRNDELACVAMSALQQCGLRVPEDVSVIGFDDSRISRYVTPGLSSVGIDRVAIAQAVLSAFDSMFAGDLPPEIHLHTQMIERGSTNYHV